MLTSKLINIKKTWIKHDTKRMKSLHQLHSKVYIYIYIYIYVCIFLIVLIGSIELLANYLIYNYMKKYK